MACDYILKTARADIIKTLHACLLILASSGKMFGTILWTCSLTFFYLFWSQRFFTPMVLWMYWLVVVVCGLWMCLLS